MRIYLVVLMSVFCNVVFAANTVQFYREDNKLKQRVPFQQCLGATDRKEVLKAIIDTSWKEFLKGAKKLAFTSVFDGEMLGESIAQRRVEALEVDEYLNIANNFVAMLEEDRSDELEISEFFPDAFLVFFGAKTSGSVAVVKAGGAIVFGFVIMPFCIKSYDLAANAESIEYEPVIEESIGVESAVVTWGGPSVGVGIGGGMKWRVGVGAIWSYSRDFVDPSDFNGFYGGSSCSAGYKLGGVTAKVGVVKKPNTMNFPDFALATYSYDKGVSAGIGCNFNAYGIIAGSVVYGVLNKRLEATLKQMAKDQSAAIVKEIEMKMSVKLEEERVIRREEGRQFRGRIRGLEERLKENGLMLP